MGGGRGAHVDDYDMGSVQGDDTPAGATTPMESEEVVTDQLGCSSVFSLKLGDPGAQLAAGGGKGGAKRDSGGVAVNGAAKKGTAVKGAAASKSDNNNNDDETMSEAAPGGAGGAGGVGVKPRHGVEALEAELSAGLLMGLRSGGRRNSAQ